MKFTLETGARNVIRGYGPEGIRIGEQLVARSCIVTPQQLISDWRPLRYAQLVPEDLDPLLALEPEIVLLGTGARQQFPSRAVRARLAGAGLGHEVMDLGAACRTFNVLLHESRRVAAALFID